MSRAFSITWQAATIFAACGKLSADSSSAAAALLTLIICTAPAKVGNTKFFWHIQNK